MREFLSPARLSELVGLIYDCAVEPTRWPRAMEAIRAELDFHNATLDLILLPSGVAVSSVVCNVPAEYQVLMADAGPDAIDQWGGPEFVQSLPLDRPAILSRVNVAFDAATSTNPYYAAFGRPQGIVDVLAIPLARDARAIGSLSFGRHKRAGPIGEREIAIAQLLTPHVQRAATINRFLETAANAEAGLVATLDILAVPIFLLGESLDILHANPAAQRLLARETLIRARSGKLEVITVGASRALTTAIAQAARDESAIGRQGLGIPVAVPGGSTGALHILPLRARSPGPYQGAIVALFVTDIDSPFVAPTGIVAALFDLTNAEARVFDHIVAGRTSAAVAAALGVEPSTVKTHLARLYDKIGVRRRADLVRVAASLAIPAEA